MWDEENYFCAAHANIKFLAYTNTKAIETSYGISEPKKKMEEEKNAGNIK